MRPEAVVAAGELEALAAPFRRVSLGHFDQRASYPFTSAAGMHHQRAEQRNRPCPMQQDQTSHRRHSNDLAGVLGHEHACREPR